MKYILFGLLLLNLQACNKSMDATPSASLGLNDFNFYSYQNNGVVLYLRPYQDMGQATALTLGFSSNLAGALVIENDTLLPGDKMTIPYRKFVNYRIVAQYLPWEQGNTTLGFTVTLGNKNKTSSIKLTK